jgi:hypothetical protein
VGGPSFLLAEGVSAGLHRGKRGGTVTDRGHFSFFQPTSLGEEPT